MTIGLVPRIWTTSHVVIYFEILEFRDSNVRLAGAGTHRAMTGMGAEPTEASKCAELLAGGDKGLRINS